MQKTLFNKYFTICSSIILISITFLGVVLMIFASQYFKEDKYTLLSQNVTALVGITNDNLRQQQYFFNQYLSVDASYLSPYYLIMGRAIDADIFLVNMEGRTLVCSHAGTCNHSTYLVPSSILDQISADGEFRENGRLGGVYDSPYYTVGQPVLDTDGQVVGVVFASTRSGSLTNFLVDILQMFVISAVVVMLFSFIVIYFITSNLVRPLQEMLAATQSFSKGDFSIRVPVEGNDEVAVLVSGLGATPVMELYVLYNEIEKIMKERGISIHRSYVGNYFTSLEMMGATLSVMKLDDELRELLDVPAETMGLKQF